MTSSDTAIDRLDWAELGAQLDAEGYALLPGLFDTDAARRLTRQAESSLLTRVPLSSSGLGRGDLFYFGARLPAPLETWRAAFYRHLAVIANRWNETLDVHGRYPAELGDFLERNRKAGQTRAQSHLNRLGVEGHISLHQRNDGEQMFPMQVVALLSEPDIDFEGGEFVMTEQRPRMQSRGEVVSLRKGDAAVFAVHNRPVRGTRGTYRVNLRHGVSRLRSGRRHTLGVIFHDAK